MRIAIALLVVVGLSTAAFSRPRQPVKYQPILPPGAVSYKSEIYTQEIAITNNLHRITRRHIRQMANTDWHQSGGMHGIKLATSQKHRYLPPGQVVEYRLASVQVLNSFGHYQSNTALVRTYPVGTRFDDVLYYAGRVFEHRVRVKTDRGWRSRVDYSDRAWRPPGYNGLTTSCAHCHDKTQTGPYGGALVPGSDTVFSDPMDWSVAARVQWYQP